MATTVFTLVCVAVFQLVWVPRVTRVLVEAETREIDRQVHVVIDGLVPFLLGNQSAAVYEALDSLSERHGNWKRIVLSRADGRQMYPLGPVETPAGPEMVDIGHEIFLRGERWGRIDATVDISGEIAILHAEMGRLGTASIGFLLLSFALLWLVVDRLVIRRIAQLAAAADRLGSGDYEAELPAASGDEVGRLTESFSAMRHQILGNVSTLEQARSQAESALQAKSRFLATMSHELRTPLNGILPAAELLGQSRLDRGQSRLVDTIAQSSRSLLTIVDDILDLTAVEEGRLELRRAQFEARALVNGVAEMLRPSAMGKGLRIACDIDPFTGSYMGDEDRLRQVLVNLVGNAIKFTEQGTVTIRCRPQFTSTDWTELAFEVEDTGMGIDPADQQRIFERFEQADGGLTRRYGGSGLGLSIVRHLVRAMGGDIELTSRPGEGSIFRFVVTFDNASEPRSVVRAPVAPPERAPEKTLSILLADDNEINLEVTTAMLETFGHRVEVARDGAEALDAVTAGSFDLVLMDVHMPRMDGLEATRRIRALPGPQADLPVLALTASVLAEDVARCRDAGMDDVLSKPVTVDMVKTRLATAIRQRAAGTRPL